MDAFVAKALPRSRLVGSITATGHSMADLILITNPRIMMLKFATLSYFLTLTALVVGADLGLLKPLLGQVHLIPFGDKTCHFVLVGMLSFLICANVAVHTPVRSRRRFVVVFTILVLAVLTSLEELSHSQLVNRQFSHGDMLCNVSGAIVFGLLSLLLPVSKAALNDATQPPKSLSVSGGY